VPLFDHFDRYGTTGDLNILPWLPRSRPVSFEARVRRKLGTWHLTARGRRPPALQSR
jgi:hypothetical protein